MRWDLSKIYRAGFEDPAFHQDLEQITAVAEEGRRALEAAQPGADDARVLKEAVTRAVLVSEQLSKVSSLLFLTLSADAHDEGARRYRDRITQRENQASRFFSALNAYVGQVDDLEAAIGEDPLLVEHRYFLSECKKKAGHLIDKALEETVLTMRMTGGRAFSLLRDQLEASLLIDVEVDGEVKRLPLPAVRGMAYAPDAQLRKRAYEAELAAYPRIEVPMAACLNGVKGEMLTLCKLRHYESPLHKMMDDSKVDSETLRALMTTLWEARGDFQRYFKAKAKALGHKSGKLPFYDLYAPMGATARNRTLEEARAYLVEVLGKFSPKMARFADNAFEQRWIDAYPREGKQGGAFCQGVQPLGISYIIANFDGSLSSVCTLAHELGHAYHNECLRGKSVLNSDYPMTLAETASIFNETLLIQMALNDAQEEEAFMLLDQVLSEASVVIIDVISRFLFEKEVFERRGDHLMNPEELCGMMLEAQRQAYGEGLDEKQMHPYMWACKMHYYHPELHFYNFPYAFGLLFGLGAYDRYVKQGAAFLPEYDRLLAATSTGDSAQVAASVGMDVRDIGFWKGAMSSLVEKIDRFCQMAER